MFHFASRLVTCLFLCGTLCTAEEVGVWLDVPFVAQEKNACGAASIAMVMQYWESLQGKPVTADAKQIGRVVYSRQEQGILASEMKRYLQQQGYLTLTFQGAWNDLKEHLKKGRPVIVALSTGSRDRHYVVVAGLDWIRGVVLKNDPAERKLIKQDRSSFEKQWKAAGNWTLLAVPQHPDSSSSQ